MTTCRTRTEWSNSERWPSRTTRTIFIRATLRTLIPGNNTKNWWTLLSSRSSKAHRIIILHSGTTPSAIRTKPKCSRLHSARTKTNFMTSMGLTSAGLEQWWGISQEYTASKVARSTSRLSIHRKGYWWQLFWTTRESTTRKISPTCRKLPTIS